MVKWMLTSDAHCSAAIANLPVPVLFSQNDQRYLLLEFLGSERKELVERYIEELAERGPPPPPTASEPQRGAPGVGGASKSGPAGAWQPV